MDSEFFFVMLSSNLQFVHANEDMLSDRSVMSLLPLLWDFLEAPDETAMPPSSQALVAPQMPTKAQHKWDRANTDERN